MSFFHGSNDGQKGMGLIMLILIGTVPTAYALNHAREPDGGAGVHRCFNAGRDTFSTGMDRAAARPMPIRGWK